MLHHGFEEPAADGTPLVIRVDPEALDPAARLLEAELAPPQVREHESDELTSQLCDLARVGVAPQIVHDPALPHIGPIHARQPLVDRDDAGDIKLGEGADADLLGDSAHGLSVSHPALHAPRHRVERRRRAARWRHPPRPAKSSPRPWFSRNRRPWPRIWHGACRNVNDAENALASGALLFVGSADYRKGTYPRMAH